MDIKGVLHIDKDSFFIGKPGKWIGFHVDTPWCEEAKSYGNPASIIFHFLVGVVTVYLPSKYEMQVSSSNFMVIQTGWTWPKGYRWSPHDGSWGWEKRRGRIVFYPSRKLQCQKPIDSVLNRNGEPRDFICGAWRWHRGPCAGTIPATWFETSPTGPRRFAARYEVSRKIY